MVQGEQEQKQQENQDHDRFFLEVREIEIAVKNLMELERTMPETDLILKIKAATELLFTNHEEKPKEENNAGQG